MRPHSPLAWFTAGAAAMLMGTLVLAFAWSELARLTTASTVHQPLLAALERLHALAERGDHGEVTTSLEQLRRCWEAYAFADGETPEQFAYLISATGTAACKATGRASSGEPAPLD